MIFVELELKEDLSTREEEKEAIEDLIDVPESAGDSADSKPEKLPMKTAQGVDAGGPSQPATDLPKAAGPPGPKLQTKGIGETGNSLSEEKERAKAQSTDAGQAGKGTGKGALQDTKLSPEKLETRDASPSPPAKSSVQDLKKPSERLVPSPIKTTTPASAAQKQDKSEKGVETDGK